jgi:2-polyprenyl-3-methyl-5-hydroxy-6-metoxy-1,4-benzoquinol methylase
VAHVPTDVRRQWNNNVHYYRLVLDEIPAGARTALDAGTGDGLLAADLRERIPAVTGIDVDAPVLDRARQSGADVEWVLGDVVTHPLPENHFDVVASITVVHHLPDLGVALARLATLTAPGGVLVVVGCARSTRPVDLAVDGVGVVQANVLKRTRVHWKHTAPVNMHFPHSYAQVRRIASTTLPGMRWRRLPMFRYAVIWNKPA